MAVRITNRARKSIRNLYWRSTRKNIQRRQETKSLVDAMIKLVNTTPLVISSENRGILSLWRSKGYTIYESTHCFVRYASGVGCKPMDSRKNMKRKWYFACVVDAINNIVYIVNAVFARYVDRLEDDTPTATKFMSAMKAIETRRRNKQAQQLTIQFPETESLNRLNILIDESVHRCLSKFLSETTYNIPFTHIRRKVYKK